MLRSCPYCGRIHPVGYECPAKTKRVYKNSSERKQRQTYSWHKKSEEIRKRSGYMCAVCKDKGEYLHNADALREQRLTGLEVHHITKLRDGGELLDDSNLICLCVRHHKQADNNEIEADYLRRLAEERDSMG